MNNFSFEQPPRNTEPVSEHQEAIVSPEQQKMEVMEKAHQGRLTILASAIKEKIDEHVPAPIMKAAESVLGFTVIGHIKRGKMAITGKDFSGESVPPVQRTLSALVVASSALFWGLTAYAGAAHDPESLETAAKIAGGTLPFTVLQMGPQILNTLRTTAEAGGKTSLVSFIDSTRTIFQKAGFEKVNQVAQELHDTVQSEELELANA